jgi:hypothetical protein
MLIPDKNIRNFWAKVNKTDNCWMWTGCVDKDGYGQITIQYKSYKAHRISWQMHCSEIPKGLIVCHHCDVPQCVNPDHLFLGTVKDNADDMMNKGRQLKGDRNHNAILDDNKVIEIKRLIAQGKFSLREIGDIFGVTTASIWQIKDGRSWRHLNENDSISH